MSTWTRLVRWMLLLLCIAGLVGVSIPLSAQGMDDPQALRFRHLTIADGLSHNAITSIVQDRQGFMWIGTRDGLNRFDGYRFTTYRYEPDDPHSLSNNHVRAIVEDRHGALWIATQGGGLNRFDPTTERFTHYAYLPDTGVGGDGGSTFSILEDHGGNLWIGSPPPFGLASLEAAQVAALAAGTSITPTFRQHSIDVNVPGSGGPAGTVPGGFRGGVQAFIEDPDGILWMAADLALIRFDSNAGEMKAYVPHPEESRLNALARDAAGNLWVGGTTGLYQFDPQTEQFTAHDLGFEVEALYVDQETLWIGGAGLYAFNLRTKQITQQVVHEEDVPDSLSGEIVTAISKDAGGVMWVGTSEGLDRFDPRQAQFSHYSHVPGDETSLPDDQIQAIAGDATGKVWLATPQVLVRLDPASGVMTRYAPEPNDDSFKGLGLSALHSDDEGAIWTGAGDRLYRLDVATGDFELYDDLRARAQFGPSPLVSAIVEDDTGDLWIAMTLVGLHHFNRETGTFETYLRADRTDGENSADLFQNVSETIISDRLSALHIGRTGDLWIGYREGILSRLDPHTGNFTHFNPEDFGEPSGFGWINDIYEAEVAVDIGTAAEVDVVWLATRNGLVRFEPSTLLPASEKGVIRRYTEKDGLPAAYIQSILAEQGSPYLWLGTANGLARFDPRTETAHNFDALDGLGGTSFNAGAAWQAPDGRMYFGSTEGLIAFYPDQVTLSAYEPPVVLTELRLANEAVAVGLDSLLLRPIWETEHLTLQHDDDIVSFAFAALDYVAPHKLQYRYRLEGLETDWVTVDSEHRFATYTHLPAGDYVFRVQGTNASGLWSADEATLALTVLPPWWETWWFRSGLFLVITAILGGFVHWRIHDIRRRNAELETLVGIRTAELADEKAHVEATRAVLRTVLNNIDALIYVADMETYEILFINAKMREIFGDVEGQICWQSLQEGREGPCSFCSNMQLLSCEGQPTGIHRWQFQNTRNGRWYTVADSAVEWIDGRCVRLSMSVDITKHKEAEQRLLTQQRLLAALDERERIGRELHDDLGQVMGYVNTQAKAAQLLLEQERYERVLATLRQLAEVAQEAHADVRQHILNVRTPTMQSPRDFLVALEHYLQQLQARYGLAVHVNWPQELRQSPLAPAVETQLLRIIQEALTNVRKHADVTHARLIFTVHPEEIQVIISDEGQGFDLSNFQPRASSREYSAASAHFGLTIMRERAEKVGGHVEIHSQLGAGTQIMVRLPRTLASRSGEALQGLRVLLVDDHDLYLRGLRNLLSARGLHVVALAHDGLEAQQLAQQYLPDLILMDVEMPRCSGLEATRRIKSSLPDVRIVMLTVAATEETLFQALKNGASGYLLKDLDSEQFFDLLCKVMQGEQVLSPALAARALQELTEEGDADTEDATASLTPRQREVLEWVAQGLTNREIAQRLHISPDTVKYHVSQILDRLQVQSRYELAGYTQTSTTHDGSLEK